jgi:hypothetical protein
MIALEDLALVALSVVLDAINLPGEPKHRKRTR